MLEKGIHAFEHKADIHCTATDKHFHKAEHHCAICELTITNSTYLVTTDFQLHISVQHFLFLPFIESINTLDAFQYLPARAPPIA
jgi:hypothetical protein